MKWHNEDVIVKRTKRKKTLDIVIERNGSLCVLAPEKLEEEKILDILDKKEYEITIKITQWKETHQNKVVRRFIDGQSFMYLGRNYCLQFVENQRINLLLKNGKFLMSSNVDNPRQAFVDFYKSHAKEKIKERFDYFKSLLSFNPAGMAIRDIQNRWGSCTPGKNIFYHWKVAMLPPKVIDYIVLHELMHIKYHRHSQPFWNEIANIMPDYLNAVSWLKEHGIYVEL